LAPRKSPPIFTSLIANSINVLVVKSVYLTSKTHCELCCVTCGRVDAGCNVKVAQCIGMQWGIPVDMMRILLVRQVAGMCYEGK
jgi:hypothetical protein